ncbi:outer membrane protein assembly factor BamD [Pseudaeromonas sharmana]|uniref:Outer membrane protein assembly factor BamD n=1 Tax=Pseudaeromonas sharmana TaxID=328412 RepID=A0ABV8CLL1_9GAMM
MLKKSHLLLPFTLVLALLAGCSSTEKEKVPDEPPEKLYQQAQEKLETGNYTKAVELLEALDSRYPFGPYSAQVQLDLIYAYYKDADSAHAIANIDRFLRLNPTHKDVDYVYYMRGLSNMQADYNFFHSLFGIDRSDRDPAYARQAFRDFKTILTKYPQSKYAPDARARMISLRERLSKYDLSVADYYYRRGAWVAAANRGKMIIENYSESAAIEPALEIMIKSYDKLELTIPAQNARKVLAANFPNNDLAKR